MALKKATLDLEGADCASCVYTIERAGRKVQGARDVEVSAADHEVRVTFDGDPRCLQRIVEIVRTLGYEARVRSESAVPAEDP